MSEITTNTDISLQHVGGELRIDHRIVAEGLRQKSHKDWRHNILEKYEADIADFGGVFKTTLDDGTVVWHLNEDQVNFVGSLSRNSRQVINFKKALVKEFSRARTELASLARKDQIIKACILPQPTPWQKRFEADYYDQLSRLTDLKAQGHKRPARWGALTKELIYDYLPEGVTAALMECRRQHGEWQKLHQFLSPEGLRAFENHMRSVQNFMIAASSLDDLRRLLHQSATRSYQLLLF